MVLQPLATGVSFTVKSSSKWNYLYWYLYSWWDNFICHLWSKPRGEVIMATGFFQSPFIYQVSYQNPVVADTLQL